MTVVSMDPRMRARRVEVLRSQGQRRLRRLVMALGVLVTAIVIFLVLRSPLFDVDTIRVEGATNTPVAAVEAIASPLESQPLLEVDTSQVEAEIAALPWVDQVTTSRALDGTLTVSLTERTAAAALIGPNGWLLVDLDGRIVDEVEALPAGLVVVDGATWNAAPGDWVSERALPGIELASLLPASLQADVAAVIPGDEATLLLYGGGRVVLGDLRDLDQKFLAVLTMLDQVPLECLDRIDVRAARVPVLTRLDECS